jgi:hypothetical protein
MGLPRKVQKLDRAEKTGIGPPGPNRVKTTLGVRRKIPGRCNIVLRPVRADFPEQCAHPAAIIRFKQIPFLDHTGSGVSITRDLASGTAFIQPTK